MRTALLFVLVAACGGKIDGSVEGGTDASTSVDAKSDPPPTVKDAGPIGVDAGLPACGKSMDTIALNMLGDCKMGAEWQCGVDGYTVNGGCSKGALTAYCTKNNAAVQMIGGSCNCMDTKFAQLFAKLCGFPPPQ